MKSNTTKRFRKAFSLLPDEIKDQGRNAYRQFKINPWHSSLRFKCVHPTLPIYSARICKGYRAVGQKAGNKIVWFWIDSHGKYDLLLKQL